MHLRDAFYRYTSKPDVVYAIALEWPTTVALNLSEPITTPLTTVTLLGLPDVKLSWKSLTPSSGIMITIPPLSVAEMPCQWAWVFRMSHVE